jgi:hypothetical protein
MQQHSDGSSHGTPRSSDGRFGSSRSSELTVVVHSECSVSDGGVAILGPAPGPGTNGIEKHLVVGVWPTNRAVGEAGRQRSPTCCPEKACRPLIRAVEDSSSAEAEIAPANRDHRGAGRSALIRRSVYRGGPERLFRLGSLRTTESRDGRSELWRHGAVGSCWCGWDSRRRGFWPRCSSSAFPADTPKTDPTR